MKKCVLFFAFVWLVSCQTIEAQHLKIKKGDFTTRLGVGLLPTFLHDKTTMTVPPVNVVLGCRVAETFSLNGYFAYSSARSVMLDIPAMTTSDITHQMLMTGLRMEAHSSKFDDFEIYGGFMLGYVKSFITHRDEQRDLAFRNQSKHHVPYNYKRPTGKVFIAGFVGGSYYFIKNTGFYLEIGYGISIVNAGLTFKL